MSFLNIARDGAIWTLTMNQPETRNALTGNTAVEEFVQVCDEIRRDASVTVSYTHLTLPTTPYV